MHRKSAALACLLCLLAGASHAAATGDPAATPDSPAQGSEQAQPASPDSASRPPGAPTAGKDDGKKTVVSPDSFTPSEEINEDLSVSFPVDI